MAKKNDRVKLNIENDDGLIIERKDIISAGGILNSFSFTVLGWLLWLFLLRPLLISGIWYLGWRISYFQMVTLEGFNNLRFFAWGSSAVIFIFMILFAWNRYNVWRFRGKERRRSRGICGDEELAAFYDINPEEFSRIKGKNLSVAFKGHGELVFETNDGLKVKAFYNPQNQERHFELLQHYHKKS